MSVYQHGVEYNDVLNGGQSLTPKSTSIIGIVGTADNADNDAFPLNTPTLVSSRTAAAALGTAGTLPTALSIISDQVQAQVVVIRVETGADEAATINNVIGQLDPSTGNATGILALESVTTALSIRPRILVAPGFAHDTGVVGALDAVASKLKAQVYVTAPDATPTDSLDHRKNFGSERIYLCHSHVIDKNDELQPACAFMAGARAAKDASEGYWSSISNTVLKGVKGVKRPVQFDLSEPNTVANLLNGQQVACVIRENGFRLWGVANCSADTRIQQEGVVRLRDSIRLTISEAQLAMMDKSITGSAFIDGIVETVEAFLSRLQSQGAIVGGSAWADPEKNKQAGVVSIDFDFTPSYAMEKLAFTAILTEGYLGNN